MRRRNTRVKRNDMILYGQVKKNLQLTNNQPSANRTAQEGREAYLKGLDGRQLTPRGAGAPRKATEDARYCTRAIQEGLRLELWTQRTIYLKSGSVRP